MGIYCLIFGMWQFLFGIVIQNIIVGFALYCFGAVIIGWELARLTRK